MEKKLSFAVFGNVFQTKKSAAISRVLDYLGRRGAGVCIESDFFRFLRQKTSLSPALQHATTFDDGDFTADFVISMGGDGTLLKAAMHVADKQIPIIGVNMGRLGFLSGITPDEIETALDAVYSGRYAVERHSVIRLETVGGTLGGCPCALNDIALLKRDNASMISIEVTVDGEYLATYQADGLIISTPTGSTAYSLSNGGPVIVPDTGVLCLTPVAPHSLNIRPVVIPDTARVALAVESRNHNFLVAVDGRSERCADTTRLTVSKADYHVLTLRGGGRSYISTLREKMGWGEDVRTKN